MSDSVTPTKEHALEWLHKELASGPQKCPLCNVIHAAYCPQLDWVTELLASYALDSLASREASLRARIDELTVELQKVRNAHHIESHRADKAEAERDKLAAAVREVIRQLADEIAPSQRGATRGLAKETAQQLRAALKGERS